MAELDPSKTYLVWNGAEFPNSTRAKFKAPAGSTIDWGDGTVETFDTESATVNTHTYTDGKTEHTIVISGLKIIYGYAFQGCTSLISVMIGNTVTDIYNSSAFADCTSLTSITIPDSVTSIGANAFQRCSSLTSITIPSSVTSIGSIAFRGCKSLTSITIPNGITNIYNSTFEDCSSLTSITIPDSVKSIDYNAFSSCYNLTSVIIGNGVTSIGNNAFYHCYNLTSIMIPDSVTTIGSDVFIYCNSLKQLILFPLTPPTLGSTDAIPSTIQSIYVRQSSKESYQTATNWTTFASKIVSNNIYLSFARFNLENKEYIDKKINDNWNEFNLENGTADVLVQTTDTNHSFKVMTDGRAKVKSAPVEDDDVVRLSEVSPILSDYVDDTLLGG